MDILMSTGLAVWWIARAHLDVASPWVLMSKKQKSVALSTAEAEYIVASMSCCEVV